jgi:hypothetical protein
MKSLLVFILVLIFLVPLARTVFAAPAREVFLGNMTRVPLKGTLQSNETYSTVSPAMYVIAKGSGEAAELGPFTVSYHTEINLLDLSEAETVNFAGRNGDSLQAKGIGQATQDRTPGMYNVVQIYTITGGTGRFAGARGTVTLKRLVSRTVGVASSTFEGYVLIPSN